MTNNIVSLTQPSQASHTLYVVPLTPDYEQSFYGLLKEQEAQHGHSANANTPDQTAKSQALFQSIVYEQKAEAFLVIRSDNNRAIGAVTYYDCFTPHGKGIYLEDIVTTRIERGHGVGKFAMSALAQIAEQRKAHAIVWECADHNLEAQHLYDRLKCERSTDQTTWRLMGSLPPIVPKPNHGFKVQQVSSLSHTKLPLAHHTDIGHASILAVTAHQPSSGAEGAMVAYRNYSTFRLVNGLHIENLAVSHETPQILDSLFEHMGHLQRHRGWTGHVDITVHNPQRELLVPWLERAGFQPLSYANDPMHVRKLTGETLKEVANLPGRIIIDQLLPTAPPLRARGLTPHPTHK